jgi:hypothetical protein
MKDRRPLVVGLSLVGVAFVVYWLSNRFFDAGRGDFFYLADAFLHGRTWLNAALGPADVIIVSGRVYVPFAPFPAIALMPLVAIIGPVVADQWQTGINAALAAASLGLCWWSLARLGVRSLVDRALLVILLGFSTQIWWVTTRGGVWHTGQLIATMLTFGVLIELEGRRRPWLVGLLAGAAFLTRAPLAFAIPFYALFLAGDLAAVRGSRLVPLVRTWTRFALGVVPAVAFFFWYNWARFGSALESGYMLAALPDWLAQIRAKGLFSTAHLAMNIDLLFTRLPRSIGEFPFFRPDGMGMSVLVTSPGLFGAIRADWGQRRSWLLLGAAVATLLPNLLYYGGGWLQYGYRYALDAIPFVIALCGIAAARRGVGWIWRAAIVFGVVVGLGGVYWAYHLR